MWAAQSSLDEYAGKGLRRCNPQAISRVASEQARRIGRIQGCEHLPGDLVENSRCGEPNSEHDGDMTINKAMVSCKQSQQCKFPGCARNDYEKGIKRSAVGTRHERNNNTWIGGPVLLITHAKHPIKQHTLTSEYSEEMTLPKQGRLRVILPWTHPNGRTFPRLRRPTSSRRCILISYSIGSGLSIGWLCWGRGHMSGWAMWHLPKRSVLLFCFELIMLPAVDPSASLGVSRRLLVGQTVCGKELRARSRWSRREFRGLEGGFSLAAAGVSWVKVLEWVVRVGKACLPKEARSNHGPMVAWGNRSLRSYHQQQQQQHLRYSCV